jgi:hypothetical protein
MQHHKEKKCAICLETIRPGDSAVSANTGKIVDNGDGPLFSVLGAGKMYHKKCYKQSMMPQTAEDSALPIDDWLDRHVPVKNNVARAATNYDTAGALAVAVKSGKALRLTGIGETTVKSLASLLIQDDLLAHWPAYLPQPDPR